MIFYAAETIAVKIDKSLVSRLSLLGRRGNRWNRGWDVKSSGWALIVERLGGKYLRINRKLMTPPS